MVTGEGTAKPFDWTRAQLLNLFFKRRAIVGNDLMFGSFMAKEPKQKEASVEKQSGGTGSTETFNYAASSSAQLKTLEGTIVFARVFSPDFFFFF